MKKQSIWKPFLRFYTRFSIPWWMFVIAFVLGIAYTEIGLQITQYTIALNTGKHEVTEQQLIEAAKAANCYDFIMEFPEGFDKDVGEGGMRLSGGQRQRIAIARAIITAPDILLMDEATASLDVESDRLVWEAMQRVMEGRTTLLIAHDMSAVMLADHVIVMNNGLVEAEGTPTELLRTSPTYREYVALQTAKGGSKHA